MESVTRYSTRVNIPQVLQDALFHFIFLSSFIYLDIIIKENGKMGHIRRERLVGIKSWWDDSGGKGAKPDDLMSTLWTHNVEKENRLP